MSRAERAKWFYNQKLIPALRESVGEAEVARQKEAHREVENTFVLWTKDKHDRDLLRRLRAREKDLKINLGEEGDLLKVGLAGLGRIEHTDANSELKTTREEKRGKLTVLAEGIRNFLKIPNFERKPLAQEARTIVETLKEEKRQQRQSLARVKEVKALYQRLKIDSLLQRTIHGGSINWKPEIIQDQANTDLIIGNREKARNTLSQGVIDTATEVMRLHPVFNKRTKVGKEEKDAYLLESGESYEEGERRYLGSLSALGVLEAREAKEIRSLRELKQGVAFVSEAFSREPNPDRLATVSRWLLRAAIDRNYEASIWERLTGLSLGLRELTRVIITDSKDKISEVPVLLAEKAASVQKRLSPRRENELNIPRVNLEPVTKGFRERLSAASGGLRQILVSLRDGFVEGVDRAMVRTSFWQRGKTSSHGAN